MNQRRLLIRPLIKAVGGNQTSTMLKGFTERRFDRDGFARGVENPFGFIPRCEKSPFGHGQLSLAIIERHDGHSLRDRDVQAWPLREFLE